MVDSKITFKLGKDALEGLSARSELTTILPQPVSIYRKASHQIAHSCQHEYDRQLAYQPLLGDETLMVVHTDPSSSITVGPWHPTRVLSS